MASVSGEGKDLLRTGPHAGAAIRARQARAAKVLCSGVRLDLREGAAPCRYLGEAASPEVLNTDFTACTLIKI